VSQDVAVSLAAARKRGAGGRSGEGGETKTGKKNYIILPAAGWGGDGATMTTTTGDAATHEGARNHRERARALARGAWYNLMCLMIRGE
jgi:hypothetical protein